MTVAKIPIAVDHYIALAADTEPTGVPIGSTLFTYDGTNWAVLNNTAVT